MENYQVSKLKEYIDETELVIINDNFRIRLSEELLEKYNQGLFNDRLSIMVEHIELVKSLGIKYPANANPIFYLYICSKR